MWPSRRRLRSGLLRLYQRLSPTTAANRYDRIHEFLRSLDLPDAPAGPAERKPPSLPHQQELRRFLRSLDMPDDGARSYLEIHLERIVTTLALAPTPGPAARALELGTYMHMAPALACVLGYNEVRGAYYGPLGQSQQKSLTSGGRTVFQCRVDLFDAEKDRYPYDDGAFACVLACEIFEHFLHDPMHMLLECRRVLQEGGVLVLTTPNAASATAVARVLEMSGNPQLYSKYADPRGPYAATEFGHMREYTPAELEEALRAAGFETEWLFTTFAPGYDSHTWVLGLLRELTYPSALRGEQMYATARKRAHLPVVRYPGFLYEGS